MGFLFLLAGETNLFTSRNEKSDPALLYWVFTQSLVFFDVGDKTAWLVYGASALLHLARVSIEKYRTRPAYVSKWKVSDALQLEGDSSLGSGGVAAVGVLGNFNNLNLPLYTDDIIPNESGELVEIVYRFRDRVQEILHDLQICIDYQTQVAAKDSYWFNPSRKVFVKSLAGFDFWDVAKPTGPIQQRTYNLQTGGHGWVDYIRSISATTIFGRNFGELLQPQEPDRLCAAWKTVPKDRDYLGAAIATLRRIHGSKFEKILGFE